MCYFQDDPRSHPKVNRKTLGDLNVSLPQGRDSVLDLDQTDVSPHPRDVRLWLDLLGLRFLVTSIFCQSATNLKVSTLLTSLPFFAGLIGNTVGGVFSDMILADRS
jgi:hypothetical protein